MNEWKIYSTFFTKINLIKLLSIPEVIKQLTENEKNFKIKLSIFIISFIWKSRAILSQLSYFA